MPTLFDTVTPVSIHCVPVDSKYSTSASYGSFAPLGGISGILTASPLFITVAMRPPPLGL